MPSTTDFEFLFNRTNPVYQSRKNVWERSQKAYSGGDPYIKTALVKHLSEIDIEFAERQLRAYYYNYPRRIAKMISQFALKVKPQRKDANPDICEDFTRSGTRIDDVMRQFSTIMDVYGCAWLCVDAPANPGQGRKLTKADEKKLRLRPYGYVLNPLNVVDWCRGADGLLEWVLVAKETTSNADPFSHPKKHQIRELWTRQTLYRITRGNDISGISVEELPHNLGTVPFIYREETDGYGMDANHWFEDIVRISDAILNNESEAQMNTVKQMFGLLVLPEGMVQNSLFDVERKAEEYKQKTGRDMAEEEIRHMTAVRIARSSSAVENETTKGITRYEAPSGVETASIADENIRLRSEMYNIVGAIAQKDSKAVESAEAKAFDHENWNAFLTTRADMLEQTESEVWKFMNLWNSSIQLPTLSYNREFKVADLEASVRSLVQLSGVNTQSETYLKSISKAAVSLLSKIRELDQGTVDKIMQEIETSKPLEIPEAEDEFVKVDKIPQE